jgi:hypothetical protein
MRVSMRCGSCATDVARVRECDSPSGQPSSPRSTPIARPVSHARVRRIATSRPCTKPPLAGGWQLPMRPATSVKLPDHEEVERALIEILRARGNRALRAYDAYRLLADHFKSEWKQRNPPVRAAGQAGRGFLGEGFLSQRLARAATSALSRSASKALGLKSSPSHSRVSAWRSWPGSSSASSISP